MGPARTSRTPQQGESSAHNTASHSKRKSRGHHPGKESVGQPGIQKIKSGLRQAQRLLAKDKLAANVRVETERRLKALEADLAQAQTSKKERDLAVRYHKVKFFERQKVVRKLNQTKKQLEFAASPAKAQLEAALTELRVDLNYILHYPKTKKYISLYPPEIREDTSSETPIPKVNPISEDVRSWIRERMESGELSTEPELHLDSRGRDKGSSRSTEWHSSTQKASASKTVPLTEEPEDAFFGDDIGE